MKIPTITIINNKDFRGILGPASAISREMLTNMRDIIGYSNLRVIERINRVFKVSRTRLTDGRRLRKSLGV